MLVFNQDVQVAQWANKTFGYAIPKPDMAIGVLGDDGLKAAAFFHAWSGHDIEVSYYGPNTLNLGIARQLARIAVDCFGVSRITARTSKNNKLMVRKFTKLGFEFEGIRHCAYGKHDAVMYGLYGKNLARLAGKAVH